MQVGREEWNNYWAMRGKNLIRELCYKGEERERERERSIYGEGRPELVTVRVWGKKKKREERKSKRAYCEREIVFPKKKKKNWKTAYRKQALFLLGFSID